MRGANVDASFRGTGNSPPLSPVILDYMYGVAAYTLWGMGRKDGMVETYYKSSTKASAVMTKVTDPDSYYNLDPQAGEIDR